ncbi:Protein of unknown function [Escherichia coli D6-117.29]|nr:Protein of unknown function [Escherichia coli D6-113.11]CDP75691.1 Protein of unknown function [Escherichia coli D6-117.29]CDU36993.1 Protein of unknown function [Escherichia coli D6-113.11]
MMPSLRVPVWHPDLQLPPKSCKVCLQV